MAIKGIRMSDTREYVCKNDKEDPTKWLIGPLSSRAEAHLKDHGTRFVATNDGTGNVAASINGNQIAVETVRLGLRGWENFNDAEGNPIPYETEPMTLGNQKYASVKQELIDMIPLDVLRELREAINAFSVVTQQEGKE